MPEPLIAPRALVTDAIVTATAEATGLRPEQITGIEVDSTEITIRYTGARPGLLGGQGRDAVLRFETQTGRLISDEQVA